MATAFDVVIAAVYARNGSALQALKTALTLPQSANTVLEDLAVRQ